MRNVFLLCLLTSGVALGQSNVTVTPAGLTVIWKEQSEKHDEREFEHFSILNSQHPVTLALYFRTEGKGIVEVIDSDSKLTAFTDDQGTDLKGEMGHFSHISKNGKAAMIDLNGKKRVSPQATSVVAKGSVKLKMASKKAAVRSKVVEVKKGSKVVLDDKMSFEITKAGKPDWGDDPFAIELSIKRDIPEVAELRFFDEAGKQIEASSSGGMRSGFLGKVTVAREFILKRKVAKVCVEVDRWTDMEETEVPFEVKAGLGGAAK